MSKSIELSDSAFAALEAAATASGLTPAEWVAARLPRRAAPKSSPRKQWDEFVGRTSLAGSEPDNAEHPEAPAKQRTRRQPHPVTALLRAADVPDAVNGSLHNAMSATEPPAAEARLEEEKPRQTLGERLKGRVGLFHSGRSDLSERHSELFMEGLLEQRRLGTL